MNTRPKFGTSIARIVAVAAGALLLVASAASSAQTPERPARIGILVGGSIAQRGHLEQALLDGLREQGYVEGRNLVVERRYANGEVEKTPGNARELAALKLDAIVTTCTPTTRAAQQAGGNSPIVMAAVADPVGQNLIASLARPGANLTGLSSQAEDIMPRMLAYFASVLPRPATIAVLADSASAVHPLMWEALRRAAGPLDVRLVKVEAGRPVEARLPAAFESALREKANGILVLPDEPLFLNVRTRIVELAARHRLPAFYGAREFVDAGGLMSYGENLASAYRNAASYVRRVANGADPALMPVAQPTRFELVINAKTAGSLGLVIPQAILVEAEVVR